MSAQAEPVDNLLHIIPLGDLREHSLTAACWCEPDLDEEGLDNVLVHHALDGREAFERGLRRPS